MVRRMAEERGGTLVQEDEAVAATLATIKEALQQGDPVMLHRFGTWQVRAKRARIGHNPRTGGAAAIAARRVVRCAAAQTVQQVVAGAATPMD
jgi:integration host factor subunit alpha